MIDLRERPLPSGKQGDQLAIDPRSPTRAAERLAPVLFGRPRAAAGGQSGGNRVLPTIASGQLWLIEASPSAAALPPFERDAFNAANVVIYDRALAPLVAASLPLGSYAEPASDGAAFERSLRLALDGWSVVRLLAGDPASSDWADRFRRIAAQLRGAGIAAEMPVRLVTDLAGRHETTETSLGELAGMLDAIALNRRVTAVFATRDGVAGPLYAVTDSGPAG